MIQSRQSGSIHHCSIDSTLDRQDLFNIFADNVTSRLRLVFKQTVNSFGFGDATPIRDLSTFASLLMSVTLGFMILIYVESKLSHRKVGKLVVGRPLEL